ncbi:MAG: hypothetical protein WCT10_02875 [Patescibacteria group bacterium]
MIQDRTPQFVIWSVALTILCFATYAAVLLAGLAPVIAVASSLAVQCMILTWSLVAAFRTQPSAKKEFPRGPVASLLPILASASLATPLCWTIFKLTSSAAFFVAGCLVLMVAILFALFKDPEEQVKFGAIIANAIVQVTLIMFALT